MLTKANDVVPVYRHWNGLSDNYLSGNAIAPNSTTDTYQTSVPVGGVNDPDSKLYPFKYKTSDYPLRTETSELIALDTANFFVHADGDKAARWVLQG